MSQAAQPSVSPRRAYPANVTFKDLIRANKRKSWMLAVFMILLASLLGAVFGGLIGGYAGMNDVEGLGVSAILGLVAATVVGILAALWSYFGGASAILAMSGAKEIQKADDPQLFNVVEELAIAAGIPMPRVYVMNDTALNAFATGRNPEHAAVAITTGLRQTLRRDELAAVMAHELSHVRHYDIRFAMLMATMVGLIVFFSDAFWRVMWHGRGLGGRSSRGDSKGGGAIMLVMLIVAVILAAVAPMLAMMIRLAVSRQREFLADAGAVELTRDPQGMISALKKLGGSHEVLEAANRATAHLYIVNPLKDAQKGQGHELSSAFRTHPPLSERIARLEALIQ
jgi:heat shock protein HtpX